MEPTICISHVTKKEDEDHMGRKISLYLILGLILIGFCVAPVVATKPILGGVECGMLPNGDSFTISGGGYLFSYYHADTGITETQIYHPDTGITEYRTRYPDGRVDIESTNTHH